ncbi:hypothetical protein QJS10_CPA08g01294 [Acorus calamus]|uniref:Uncharacterized protein n=1 Tax=Acorus calamus TaxID=4465 RepID=A0AAV9EB52_ACOCL|nr:hypothetical protein QJS10_CPA08g01294 [Acorus calamus]
MTSGLRGEIRVSVCIGGVFFLAFLAAILFCFAKKKKKKVVVVEAEAEHEVVEVQDHVRIQEAIVPGPCGKEVVVLNIDEDIRVVEKMNKEEREAIKEEGLVGPSYHVHHGNGLPST